MFEDQKKQLEAQLWNIANTLQGKMNTMNSAITSSDLLPKSNSASHVHSFTKENSHADE